MSKTISTLACITLIFWGLFSTQNAHTARGQSYVELVNLYRVRWGGGVYGGSVVLTADPSQANALGRLDGAEVLVLGMVFNRHMPNTVPLYRLSKPLAGRDSPERYYTTSKTKVDDLINNHGWASEGILAYVSTRLLSAQPHTRVEHLPLVLSIWFMARGKTGGYSRCDQENNTKVPNSTFNEGVRHEV